MKKLLVSLTLILISLNINATISQSGITNLKQLDKNGIIDLVSGNQLTGFISDGPFEGPIKQTYFTNILIFFIRVCLSDIEYIIKHRAGM